MASANKTWDHSHEGAWDFDSPQERIVIDEFNASVIDFIGETLRREGRVAIIALFPEKVSVAKCVADLITNVNL